jgi:drug/metabolite transporter (DMT)-like permease
MSGRRTWPLIVFTAFAWGSGGLASKLLISQGVDAFTVTAIPTALGAATAWVVTSTGNRKTRHTLLVGAVVGVLNTGIPPLLFNLGYETLTAGMVTLLLASGPIFTAFGAARVFSDEPFTSKKALGLVVAVSGVALLALSPGALNGNAWHGVVFVLCGAVVAGLSAVMVRRVVLTHGARTIMAPQMSAAALVPIVSGLALHRPLATGLNPATLTIMAAIGMVAGFGGFYSIMRANETATTGQISVVGYLLPVIGVAGGALLLGEHIGVPALAGGALILIGVTVTGRGSRKANVGAGPTG